MPFGLILSLVLLIASYAVTALTTKANRAPTPATLKDFDFPTIDEGTPQSIVFGDVWVQNPLVGYYGNLRSEGISAGGGGGKK